MNITVDVGIDQLAIYALDSVSGESDPLDTLSRANKREIFALARLSIEQRGRGAEQRSWSEEDLQRARELVSACYPELR